MASRFVVHRSAARPDGAVLTEEFGCRLLTESVFSFQAGTTASFDPGGHEELLFVVRGGGHLLVGRTRQEFGPQTGIHIAPGETCQLEIADPVEIVCVRVMRPAGDVAVGERRRVSPLHARDIGHATAGRQYRILADPSTGFGSGTHFVGEVPAGEPAPVHYHLYDEVIYVLRGNGILHVDDEHNPLSPGTCVHLPARTLHQVENTGDTPIVEVAVFVPAGSPAAAYLPDGTSAYPGVPDDPQRLVTGPGRQ
ncbi:cupin domain-containing protein [Fodinicola acaciae]|uniref:cupin domain-containing protein n=1 Tax=Fodinicola acaciae TaxID=2681555 RepID=UPI0013D16A1D|nr:cupin domain-containing protein [Fodinicola acaciae]